LFKAVYFAAKPLTKELIVVIVFVHLMNFWINFIPVKVIALLFFLLLMPCVTIFAWWFFDNSDNPAATKLLQQFLGVVAGADELLVRELQKRKYKRRKETD
jgi:ABC-type transport system involved in cytochrome bd biosynthesis fused ATPase/permease subunit